MRRICARSGCNEPVIDRNPRAIYHHDACKIAACKDRRRVADSIPLTDAEKRFPGLSPCTRRVAQALAAAGGRGCTTAELCQPTVGGVRFGARIYDLREVGFVVREQRMRNGQSRYWLVSVPGRPVLDVAA